MTDRQDIIDVAQRLVETLKARGETHGRGDRNFIAMARLLSECGYFRCFGSHPDGGKIFQPLDALDAVVIYKISKIARIVCGDRLEPDHYLDTAGYGVIGAAIAKDMREKSP